MKWQLIAALVLLSSALLVRADDDLEGEEGPTIDVKTVDGDKGTTTDDSSPKLEGLTEEQIKELRERAEKHQFQAEVSRMMKLIINSLYRTKEIFLRELISNAADALDKIRMLSLTNSDVLSANQELAIRVKADKENNQLHIIDTGIGMSKKELITNLGTIAKSGTADFLAKATSGEVSATEMNDLIGQFGVGFYSAFLVADTVVVASKSNDDPVQHIWESDSYSFAVNEDPRGDTLKRGTQITLKLKPEAKDFLEESTIKGLIEKYSQFINFPIYLWTSRVEEVEEEGPETEKPADEEEKKDDEAAEGETDKKTEEKPKKKVQKTIWDWQLINVAKPLWQRKPKEIEQSEYNEFYKTITKDTQPPLTMTHFVAEGEITFKSLLFVPKVQPSESFNRYGTKTEHIKLYVRRVFITDDFQDMMPNYLSFVRGVVDSDDLPLNVGRETLQQHKLLKVIKKKLVRKVLDMLKKVSDEDYEKFWSEYSTNIKLGVIDDTANRQRLAKLLRFQSSSSEPGKLIALGDYIKRMKEKQEYVYYIAAATYDEAAKSPFVERLLKKGFEVLYLTDAIDEYAISALPEFDGKRFQNVAKDGLKLDSEKSKERHEALTKEFEPLTKWLESDVLKERVSKAVVSQRLHDSPCALVASQFGWTGNMERLARSNAHSKTKDITRDYYLSQKKTLEINPRHPLIQELLRRVQSDKEDAKAVSMANLMFETATLRSGYMLQDTAAFASRVEQLLRQNLGVDESATVAEEEEEPEEESKPADEEDKSADEAKTDEHDEL